MKSFKEFVEDTNINEYYSKSELKSRLNNYVSSLDTLVQKSNVAGIWDTETDEALNIIRKKVKEISLALKGM